jgi:hypothetical protein
MTSTDYGDLSTTELAKQINAEYDVILDGERTTLQRYLAMGKKLVALRPRIAPKHGEWQAKLKLHCPAVSYETANLCIRFVENLDKLEAYAASKNVKVTDLGVDEARKALTKSKSNKTTDKGKPANVVKGGVAEPGNEPVPRSVAPDIALEGLENDEVFHTLQNVYENRQDELLELTWRLAESLGMTLMPTSKLEALAEVTKTTPTLIATPTLS